MVHLEEEIVQEQLGIIESHKMDYPIQAHERSLTTEKESFPVSSPIAGFSGGKLDKSLIIVERIINAYKFANIEHENLGNSMWALFFDQRHKNVHEIFLGGQLETAAFLLQNPIASDMFYGIDNFCREIWPSVVASIDNHAKEYLSNLIRLAEAIGAIPLYNPEGCAHPRQLPNQINDILNLIDKKFGQTISFPNPFIGEGGLKTSRGIITYREIQAIYQAYRIKQLVKDIPNPRVLEIGAGLGRTAFYARQLGILDYTIIDIPFTCLSSSHYLMQTLGPDNVQLFGESSLNSNSRVKVFPPSCFLNEHNSYDLIINVDSLTEFDPIIARSYFDKIINKSKLFLSINHDGNSFRIQDLVDENISRIISHERYPYWMRSGYVEQIIRCQL